MRRDPRNAISVDALLRTGPLLDVPIEGVASTFDTNCLSVLRVCKAVVPHMAPRKRGLIVNIGSITGEMYARTLLPTMSQAR